MLSAQVPLYIGAEKGPPLEPSEAPRKYSEVDPTSLLYRDYGGFGRGAGEGKSDEASGGQDNYAEECPPVAALCFGVPVLLVGSEGDEEVPLAMVRTYHDARLALEPRAPPSRLLVFGAEDSHASLCDASSETWGRVVTEIESFLEVGSFSS